ncbi:carboxylating nicotinate-nucleotide diphosphorylase [Inmirania thermothiophila]|uniref:Probable nicotinate-nucleotide pyrophosphorylase [carboxylating] n=1 Tax=Inmirania thermothiophila TaxID=1750597 RepID=A0A3N1YBS4_9GAMM|nr:carboxylating nicotinate-nucleotide diphosphorylase [Inmirania thermothiophila]ROR35122.1 nicotinate-nucleotide pyrophosphorylase [carboxylating] [Inmirania thermothiophila]
MVPGPDPEAVAANVAAALAEDVGPGDRTAALLDAGVRLAAAVVCREEAVVCGRPWFDAVFARLDPAVAVRWRVAEGERVGPGTVLCELEGPAAPLLTGERTALNFLQTLSGTATVTRRYVDAVAGTGVRILDTRKTLPGLRAAQKYAVRAGGGHNHRMGLYDAVLVKENHIAALGSVAEAVRRALARNPGLEVEVEVEDLGQLEEAVAAGARRALLDNFPLEGLREAVRIARGRCRLEASGDVTLERVRAVAETGVDDISVGALTKHVRAVDLSLRYR